MTQDGRLRTLSGRVTIPPAALSDGIAPEARDSGTCTLEQYRRHRLQLTQLRHAHRAELDCWLAATLIRPILTSPNNLFERRLLICGFHYRRRRKDGAHETRRS